MVGAARRCWLSSRWSTGASACTASSLRVCTPIIRGPPGGHPDGQRRGADGRRTDSRGGVRPPWPRRPGLPRPVGGDPPAAGGRRAAMKIGVIGAGHIGSTLARHFASAGHDVAISNSRGPETLDELAAELGERVQAMTAEDAARFGELAVIAIPFKNYRDLPADALAGKIVIDTNNYYPSRDGHFAELDDDSTTSSELLARHLPGAAVVKAFNSMRSDSLRDKARPAGATGHLGIPISGDDLEAKQVVD